jgi:hypothetical protein
MSALILLVAINLFFLGLRRGHGVREAFVQAFIVLFGVVAIATELLSVFNALTFQGLALLWAILAVFTTMLAWRLTDRAHVVESFNAIRVHMRSEATATRLCMVFIGGIMAATLAVAIAAPPNTWDSMTYHMARVAAWIQHGNVQFFPTAIERQNWQLPLGGFVVLHLQLLSRSDLFANLSQWTCFVVCIVLVSLVIKEFSQPLVVQVFGGLAMATLPEAILQASSTQTDLVCGVFCLAFAFYLIRSARDATCLDSVYAGISVGLALLSKGTGYVYVGAIGLTLGVAYLARGGGRIRSIMSRDIVWMSLLALVLNIGHWSRSYAVYAQPLSSSTISLGIEECSVSTVWANVVRNAALHLGVPDASVNQAATRLIKSLLGNEVNNPATTWPGTRFGVDFSLHEDTAGNGLHFILVFFALAGIRRAAVAERGLFLAWAGSVVVGALFFSLYLKWQPWNGRLHTPLFILAMPVVAVMGSSLWRSRLWVSTLLSCLLFIAAIPFLLGNETRPLLPLNGVSIFTRDRIDMMLLVRPDLRRTYPMAIRAALDKKPAEVGLILGEDDWEYPLWVLSGKSASRQWPEFRHVVIPNLTRELEMGRALPDVIIATRPLLRSAIAAHGYEIVYEDGAIRVLKRNR